MGPSLLTLPQEILIDGIFPLLDVKDFLAATSTCKALYELSSDEVYFRNLTHSVYHLPSQTIRQQGWKDLFRKIYTARIFTWGEWQNGRLGHSFPLRPGEANWDGIPRQINDMSRINGTVVDIQAGGWSTTVLTSTGEAYTVGVFTTLSYYRQLGASNKKDFFNKLRFPNGAKVELRQISSGRSHVLGLDKEGRAWIFQAAESPGTLMPLADRLTGRRPDSKGYEHELGKILSVRAGWSTSAAYVVGHGIVIGAPKLESVNDYIPGTASLEDSPNPEGQTLDEKIGRVVEYVACEGFLVFLTESGDVYVSSLKENTIGQPPVRLKAYSAPEGTPKMAHISGNFRNFAVFNTEGVVYLGDSDRMNSALETSLVNAFTPRESNVAPQIIPELQNRSIIKIAFGDYHRLALTSHGTVLSWGTEPQGCGALGLGSRGDATSRGARGSGQDMVADKPIEIHFHSTSSYSPGEEKKFFAFNIAAAGWHSGALVSVPPDYPRPEIIPIPEPGLRPHRAPTAQDDLEEAERLVGGGLRYRPGAAVPPLPAPGAVPHLPLQTPFRVNPGLAGLAQQGSSPHWSLDAQNTLGQPDGANEGDNDEQEPRRQG